MAIQSEEEYYINIIFHFRAQVRFAPQKDKNTKQINTDTRCAERNSGKRAKESTAEESIVFFFSCAYRS